MSNRVKVKVSLARKAAEAAIERTMEARKESFDDAVVDVKKSWLSKLFRRNWTHEQFEKYTREYYDMFPDWECIGWGTLYEAEEVLAMCKIASGGTIYLGEDAIRYLSDFFPEEDSNE